MNSSLPDAIKIGKILKTLRKERGLTGEALGKLAGLSQSKISKLESGTYPKLRATEIERITNILEAPKTIRQQLDALLLDVRPHLTIGRYHGENFTKELLQYEQNIMLFRSFGFLIPSRLQTIEFRMRVIAITSAPPDAVSKHLRDLDGRQALFWDRRREFRFVLLESALYGLSDCSRSVMLGQLDRLERFMDLPNVKIGIIPFRSGLPFPETGPFALYGQSRLYLGTASGDITIENEQDIVLYEKLYAQLEQTAVYGDEAKRLIHEAMDYWN